MYASHHYQLLCIFNFQAVTTYYYVSYNNKRIYILYIYRFEA